MALVAALLAPVWLAEPLAAHGASVDVAQVQAIGVLARYDTGAPMADAQVTVFAPDAPEQPWLTGRTDAAGRFVFRPGDSFGRWTVQVRQAGHGAMGHVMLGTDDTRLAPDQPATRPATQSWPQRLLMVACVLWGCVGTALYATRTRRGRAA